MLRAEIRKDKVVLSDGQRTVELSGDLTELTRQIYGFCAGNPVAAAVATDILEAKHTGDELFSWCAGTSGEELTRVSFDKDGNAFVEDKRKKDGQKR